MHAIFCHWHLHPVFGSTSSSLAMHSIQRAMNPCEPVSIKSPWRAQDLTKGMLRRKWRLRKHKAWEASDYFLAQIIQTCKASLALNFLVSHFWSNVFCYDSEGLKGSFYYLFQVFPKCLVVQVCAVLRYSVMQDPLHLLLSLTKLRAWKLADTLSILQISTSGDTYTKQSKQRIDC